VPPDSQTYNHLLDGLARAGRFQECEAALAEMEASGRKPDGFTAAVILAVYSKVIVVCGCVVCVCVFFWEGGFCGFLVVVCLGKTNKDAYISTAEALSSTTKKHILIW
jgi:pentatricopeptide repeat protein